MENVDKVVNAIKQVSPNERPTTIGYDEVVEARRLSKLSANAFKRACKVLEDGGVLEIIFGSNEITGISIRKNPLL
ncbi:hypothetical protein [Pediococcus acidilactici]|uniref:hypothetical protein n=1 Tax=Pediococcus acidilactici TaxID=1254 RepID=UPI003562C607